MAERHTTQPSQPPLIAPAWAAPANVGACFTTRLGGVSRAPWDSFNLGAHVGDDADAVTENRARLQRALGLETPPCWLQQVHGIEVLRLTAPGAGRQADAAITAVPGLACVVMVADCVPILLCSRDGHEVAAVHAGWRGLAGGIIARAVAAFRAPPAALLAWVGPCIGAAAYVVGDDVRAALDAATPAATACFTPAATGWHCDLAALAARQLGGAGVGTCTVAGTCVHDDATHYYSYRRDGRTGRMAALIWLKSP